MRRFPLFPLILVLTGIVLIGWNCRRFIGAEQRPRMKALDFLPSATVARMMALGQTNSVAKLRWIDSFAYFQYQLARRDDQVGGTGESGFARLYDMLIGLDPHFVPFYQHASLNLGGILGHDQAVQAVLNHGLLSLPHETQIWRMLAAELTVRSKLETNNPQAMDAYLDAWAAAEATEEGRQMVWDWKRSMAIRASLGLSQIGYWEEQLRSAPPGSPTRGFIVDTIRELLSRGGVEQLDVLRKRWQATRFVPPVLLSDLADPVLIREAFPGGVSPVAPLRLESGRPVLTPDSFGYPYRLVDGSVQSFGLELFKARKWAAGYTVEVEAAAKRLGHWPESMDEVVAAGISLRKIPAGMQWALRGQAIEVVADPPPFAAWEPRK